MLRVAIEGRLEGKRPRGRKRRMMLIDILDELKYHEKKKIMQGRERERDAWRRSTVLHSTCPNQATEERERVTCTRI